MTPLTFHAFLCGPDSYRPQDRWHPLAAALAAVGVIAAGQSVPILGVAWMAARSGGMTPGAGDREVFRLGEPETAWLMLASQVVLVLLTLALARFYRMRASDTLHLVPPVGRMRAFVFAILLMIPLLGAFNGIAYWVSPEGYVADFRQLVDLTKGSAPLAAFLAIAVGAPAWEELLFRGFLLGPLAFAFGYWPAAILVAALWTGLHLSYSLAGLTEVFLIGLYFSWLLKRTGSLWVPMACHAAYNACLFAALYYLTG